MRIRLLGIWLGVVFSLVILTETSSCAFSGQRSISLIAFPWDLYNLVQPLQNTLNLKGTGFVPEPTESAITRLKKGEIAAVLAGREPSQEEKAGLTDIIIAYDGVCIFIDENSYIGGEYWLGRKTPVRKTIGLQSLSTSDLTQILKYSLVQPEERWLWYRYSWLPLFDPTKEVSSKDANGWFRETFEVPCAFRLAPGKYDTQSVLLQSLGLNTQEIYASWSSYTALKSNREEQILAYEYMGEGYAEGAADYPFKIGFASRQVTLIALNHINIRVLPIDGINPLEDTASLYNGNYRLARRVHLLVPQTTTERISQIIDAFLSPAGQNLIQESGYLPIEQGQVYAR
jgi:hypothetical protein